MATSSLVVEPISSEPEIIESPLTQGASGTPKTSLVEKVEEIEKTDSEEDDVEGSVHSEGDRWGHDRIIVHDREREYSPRRGLGTRIHEALNLINTKSLNEFIKKDDVCVGMANSQLVYIANHPFQAADLDKISWIFNTGPQDTWMQKPTVIASAEGYKFDFAGKKRERRGRYNVYDNPETTYNDGYYGPGARPASIARLGTALRVFRSDEKKYGTDKVKFVIAVQGKNNARWLKLVVSHSRQAALVDIFHELLSGHSIQFVGAVLMNVVVPFEGSQKKVRLQRMASLKEAKEVGSDAIGVIC